VRRGGLWAKHMGLKRGAIGNTIGKHIGNLGNIKGTCWEHVGNKGKMKKIPPRQEKTRANHECMLSLPIGCMKFLFPKLFVPIFVSRI